MSVYRKATEEDFSLSGPHVWPKDTIFTPTDRFIVARPELAYLQARRRMEKTRQREQRDPEPEFIGIRIIRQHHETIGRKTRPKARALQRYSHRIDRENALDDVREFNRRLRTMLIRCMPDHTTQNCWAQIRFYDRDQPSIQLLLFSQRWL